MAKFNPQEGHITPQGPARGPKLRVHIWKMGGGGPFNSLERRHLQQRRQSTYNVTLRRVRATTVAVEKH